MALEPIFASLGTPDEAETLARLFPSLERIPIDKAVMEHAPNVRVLEVPYAGTTSVTGVPLASLLIARLRRQRHPGRSRRSRHDQLDHHFR